MMLVVVADVPSQAPGVGWREVKSARAEWARWHGSAHLRGREVWEDVVLRDEVAGAGVEPACEEDAQHHVGEGAPTKKVEHHTVEGDL
eukprot:scaffold71729_cov27-Tisochrysis_lutea.AAC.3